MRNLRLLYLGIDLRALAWVRVGLGSLLLFDLAKRIPDLGVWYVNSGLLPNHRVLWHPATPYQYSYLFSLWTSAQVRVAFALIALVYLCFLVGYRTRLFHILSWLALLSLQTRASLVANGGDYVFCTMLLWTMFMPLGRRGSIDAILARSEPTQLAGDAAPESSQFVSLSVAALRIQLCLIYLFNALNKTGATWKDGSAVHYMLHQARIVTLFGIWVREHAPSPLLRLLAYSTLVVEYAIPILIVLPWGTPWPRRVALALIWGLHTNIALLANLGVFSPVMLVYSLCLLGPEDFRWLASRERIGSGVEASTERLRRWLDRVRVYAADSSNAPRELTAFGARFRRGTSRLREGVVAVLIVCAGSQLVQENEAVLGTLAHEQPLAIRSIVEYLRLNQGWSMFAPDAPRTDQWIVVDAVTQSGRHIDPLNERASLVVDPRARSIPARLGHDVYFCDYISRIADEEDFHEALHDWILDHGRRTRRPDERVQRFDAYLIENRSPPLGESLPTRTKSRVFLSGSRGE